ncbi:MAG: hypothetical protein IIC21_00010 [Chloroflexi bacterium]|nr:hypothetical protein [Chloroflexota bacterium]
MSQKQSYTFVVPGDSPIQIQGSEHLKRLEPYGELVLYSDRPATADEKVRRAEKADVLINTRGSTDWPGDVLHRLPKLQMITTCSVGTDMIDLKTAAELGVVVSNQPGRTAPSVAEHAFGLMFAIAKRAAFQTAELRAGRWTRMDNYLLQNKTLGIVGTGNIGGELARLANAIGMDVIAWTLHPSKERAARLGVRYVELPELLRGSDVVSLHVNLTEDTRHLIGREEIALMKEGALLVNCGRGALVDTGALVDALNSGHLGGAAIDVYDVEPLPADDPILRCEQVVLTPHLADQTPEGFEALNEGAIDNVIAFLEGRPQNVVTGT